MKREKYNGDSSSVCRTFAFGLTIRIMNNIADPTGDVMI